MTKNDTHMMWHNHFWGMHFGWWIFWIVVIVAVVYWFNQNRPDRRDETPEEILKKRLARGEITPEEYEELRKRL